MKLRVLLFLCFVLYGVGIIWGLPSEYNAAIDSREPVMPMAYFFRYTDTLAASKYPAFHWFITMAAYAPLLLVQFIRGAFDPMAFDAGSAYGFDDPVLSFSLMILISRLISVAMAVGILWNMQRFKLPVARLAQMSAIMVFALSGEFSYYARTGNLDVPYIFWFSLAIYQLWRYFFDRATDKHLQWAAVFAALSMATKDQVTALIAGCGLSIWLMNPAGQDLTVRERFNQGVRFGIVAMVVYAIVAILPQPVRWVRHLQWWTLESTAVTDYVTYENTLDGQINLLRESVRELSLILSWYGLLLIGIGLLAMVLRKRYREVTFVVLPILTYYFIIIFNIRFVYARFFLPVALLLTIALAFAINEVWQQAKGKRWLEIVTIAGLGLLICLQLRGFVGYTYMQTFDTKRTMASELDQYVPEDEILLWHGNHLITYPNADVYTRYTMMRAADAAYFFNGPEFEDMLPYSAESGVRFVLSPALLTESDYPGLVLVKTWQNPAWLTDYVHSRVKHQYFLYRLENGLPPLVED